MHSNAAPSFPRHSKLCPLFCRCTRALLRLFVATANYAIMLSQNQNQFLEPKPISWAKTDMFWHFFFCAGSHTYGAWVEMLLLWGCVDPPHPQKYCPLCSDHFWLLKKHRPVRTLWLSVLRHACGPTTWTSTELICGFTLVTNSVGNRSHK